MPPEVFEQGLKQVITFRDTLGLENNQITISLCGLGEPLLNKHVIDYIRQVRAAGFRVVMSSNGSLLDEGKSAELLEAGLQQILINVGEKGDDYEEIYELPFDKTLENVVRFNEMSGGKCEVTMVLVDHRADPDHIAEMKKFWAGHGISGSVSYEVMNRGGSLFVDHMQYDAFPELAQARELLADSAGTPLCGAPFWFLFVGYDAQYYLCCSDWEKQTPMGSIFDTAFLDVVRQKLEHVATRRPVCETCNLDPINRLTEELRAEASGAAPAGTAAKMVAKLTNENEGVWNYLARAGIDRDDAAVAAPRRRMIPVQSL